jgi:HSP20 family protein
MARNPLTPFRSGGGLLGGGDPFLSLHREMNRLFDDAFRGAPATAGQGSGAGNFVNALMNVSETDNEIRITAELPGVTEQDIDVSLDDDVLTIRGEKKFERTEGGEKESFHFVERSYGTFQRAIRLPFPINPDQVKASFENGVLTVTLPKTAQAERTRRIQVRAGSAGGGGGSAADPVAKGMEQAGGGEAPQGGKEGARKGSASTSGGGQA